MTLDTNFLEQIIDEQVWQVLSLEDLNRMLKDSCGLDLLAQYKTDFPKAELPKAELKNKLIKALVQYKYEFTCVVNPSSNSTGQRSDDLVYMEMRAVK